MHKPLCAKWTQSFQFMNVPIVHTTSARRKLFDDGRNDVLTNKRDLERAQCIKGSVTW